MGYQILVAAAVLYAVGIVAQSVAARRAGESSGAGVGLLVRLTADPLYLVGFAGQAGGFALAFFARASLPLYLVQTASSSAIGLATVFGVLVLGWRIRPAEVLTLVLLAAGLVLLAGVSAPSTAGDLGLGGTIVVAGTVVGIGLAMIPAGRTATFTAPAVLSGLSFAVVAVASRTLAHRDLLSLPANPLTWLVLAAAVLGQASMAVALQRGPSRGGGGHGGRDHDRALRRHRYRRAGRSRGGRRRSLGHSRSRCRGGRGAVAGRAKPGRRADR